MAFLNKKKVAVAVLVVVGAIVVSGLWCLYSAVTVSLEAEKTLGAYWMVLDLVSTHVQKTSGEWPRSWDDLRKLSPSRETHGWKWPRDLKEIQKRIRIDFSVTCADVATQDPDSFHAIEQIGPNYGSHGSQGLLDLCRRYEGGQIGNSGKNGAAK
jgi:hypothetical protein